MMAEDGVSTSPSITGEDNSWGEDSDSGQEGSESGEEDSDLDRVFARLKRSTKAGGSRGSRGSQRSRYEDDRAPKKRSLSNSNQKSRKSVRRCERDSGRQHTGNASARCHSANRQAQATPKSRRSRFQDVPHSTPQNNTLSRPPVAGSSTLPPRRRPGQSMCSLSSTEEDLEEFILPAPPIEQSLDMAVADEQSFHTPSNATRSREQRSCGSEFNGAAPREQASNASSFDNLSGATPSRERSLRVGSDVAPSRERSFRDFPEFNGATPPGELSDQVSSNLLSPATPSELNNVSNTLQDMTGVLQTLVQRVNSNADAIQGMKSTLQKTPPSNQSSSSRSKKRQISTVVRSETRKVYSDLLAKSDDFEGFLIEPGITFNSEENVAVVNHLIKAVMALNSTFLSCDIRAAAYTYYSSLAQQKSASRRGLTEERNKVRRYRERKMRKLQERMVILQRSSLAASDKEKWNKVLIPELMSSEEDDEDGETIIIRQPPWRSSALNNFFMKLDRQALSQKSSQAKRQRKPRALGSVSTRSRPVNRTIPHWAFAANA